MGEFQKKIKSYRKSAQLSQTKFAAILHVPVSRYRNWETYVTPNYGVRLILAKQLNIKLPNTPNPPETFGQQLLYFRATEKLTADDLGAIMGVSKVTISAYEHDKCVPKLSILQKLLAKYPQINKDGRLKYHN